MDTMSAAGSSFRRFKIAAAFALAQLCNLTNSGTYLHVSKSISGPYLPAIPPGCNDSTGIWQRNDSIPFGVSPTLQLQFSDLYLQSCSHLS
eukprot:SAG31_NODE_36455_length_313_cov_0.728972_1_plen_90_part_01